MSIINKRKSVKKTDLDSKLKSKLRENFEWMKEEDDLSLEDDSELDGGADLGGDEGMDLGGDEGLGDEGMGGEGLSDEGGIADLTQPQSQELDSEVDELLTMDLDAVLGDTGTDDSLIEDGSDILDVEAPTDDVAGDMGLGGELGSEEPVAVTNSIDTNELQDIISSPNSLTALEDALIDKITSDASGEGEETPMLENEDPFKGIDDLPGFEKGYEGEDVKDELTEDVDLTKELKDLEFGGVENPLGDKVKSSVSDSGIKGGADSNVDEVNPGNKRAPLPTNIAPADVMSESIKKSKMLVKAAAAILKLKQMQEAAVKESTKLKFENAKLYKLNALLTVAGDKMTKDVRKKMVESFVKCKSQKEVDTLYGKVVNVIKEHSKPSLNKVVTANKAQVKTTNVIKESKEVKEVKHELSSQQMRKNYLMGIASPNDSYYNFD